MANPAAGLSHPRIVENAADQTFIPPRAEPSFSRLPPGCRRFSLYEVQAATGNFSDDAYIDQGGFGKVYRGTLEDGTMVAVKTLDRKGLQGDKEFEVEINVLARLRHKHLVTLRGACTQNGNRMAVFDFMPGGSLRDNLDRRRQNLSSWESPRQNLLWPARIEVALGAAKGLQFLHEGIEPGMIHRDVKSSNFLLDNEGQVRIADFGLAIHTGEMSGKTAFQFETAPLADADILTGTYGYTAPEYADKGVMSQKSDVYAFGVVLLELMTGMEPVGADRPEGQQLLADFMLPKISASYPDVEALQALLDPVIPKESVPVPQLMWFCEIASGCLQPVAKNRLRMSEVVQFLAKLDGWKQTPPQETADGRRVSISDRTENGKYTLQSLMDDSPLSLPPVREGIDLIPLSLPPGIPTGYPIEGPTSASASMRPAFGVTGNPFATPNLTRHNEDAAFSTSMEPVQPSKFDASETSPQPREQCSVHAMPASLHSPERTIEAPSAMDAAYSPLRASITGFSSKHSPSGHHLDAYAYDSRSIGPLQNGLQYGLHDTDQSGLGQHSDQGQASFPASNLASTASPQKSWTYFGSVA